jgi:hypothetical protein
MIYDLGAKMQKTDFTDVSATNSIIMQLKHDFQSASSACIVCMLHEHGGHEDQSIFPQLAPFDSKAVEAMIQEHVELTRQMVEISRAADELSQLEENNQRIEAGSRLNTMVNNLLASYLVHLNNEEATLVLLTWKYLTDDQIRAIRTKIQMATPPERYGEWMKWMVASLNVNELAKLFSGMKMAAPPQVLEKMKQLAEKNIDRETGNKIKERTSL